MTQLNKNNPFHVPDGYFGEFEGKLAQRLSQEETILPREEGFQVPQGYFDGVHGNILKKRDADETKIIPLRSYTGYWYAAASLAAMVLLFVGLDWNSTEEVTFESLGSSDIETYFDDNESDFSSYDIAEILPVDNLEIGDVISEDINEAEVLEYLDDNTDSAEELNLDYDD